MKKLIITLFLSILLTASQANNAPILPKNVKAHKIPQEEIDRINKFLNSKEIAIYKQKIKKIINSKSYQTNRTKAFAQVKRSLNIPVTQDQSISGHRFYLFVSSTIPEKNLRSYARQLAQIPNAKLVLRGFIGGAKKMAPTLKFIKKSSKKNPFCSKGINCPTHKIDFIIDPVLFQRYNIKKVPTLVFVENLTGSNNCSEGNTNLTTATGIHQFTGLAPISHMLTELEKSTNSPTLKQIIRSSEEFATLPKSNRNEELATLPKSNRSNEELATLPKINRSSSREGFVTLPKSNLQIRSNK